MSLNGLDERAVIDAYHAALAEPGGWLLLKYATRDTIDLLQRGTGGVVEVRIAIEHYQERSPVYGLVHYRRRRIVLKYVPEGTSRLLQARLTVQFQSILENFTPYDTVFSFATATELTDSALSSACMLHTSIGSLNSSTSSLRGRRLGEIAEDTEEGAGGERCKSGLRHSILSDADSGSKEGRNNLAVQAPATSSLSGDSHLPKSNGLSSPASQVAQLHTIQISEHSLPASPGESPQTTLDDRATDGAGRAAIEELVPAKLEGSRPSPDSRPSSQSNGPSALELDRAKPYTEYNHYKPKVKIGPRPSAQRPQASGSGDRARPVANLPNTIRVSTRLPSSASRPSSSASHRPTSQKSDSSTYPNFVTRRDQPPPPPLPQPCSHDSALCQPADTYLLDRPTSSALSGTFSVTPSVTSKKPAGITPERQRLMKALQLRKKQQTMKTSQVTTSTSPARSQEPSKMLEVFPPHTNSDPAEMKENISQHKISQLMQYVEANTSVAGSSSDIVPRLSPQNSAIRTDTMADSIESAQIGSCLDSQDVEVVSSTTESTSATIPNLKSIPIAQRTSPILPTITPQSRLSNGVLSPPLEHFTHSLRQTTIAEAEEEVKTDATAPPPRAQSDSAPLVKTAEEQSLQPEPAPLVAAVKDPALFSSHLRAQSEITVKDKSTASTIAENLGPGSADRRTRRRGTLEQENAVVSPEASEISDNESLYDELQAAIVEEAKPVMVARPPSYAVFNRGSSDHQREHNRSISILSRKTDESSKSTPEKAKADGGRSLSSALPPWPPASEAAQSLLVKNSNVSTGISKRIKALEMFSGQTDVGASSPNSAAPPSPPLTAGLVKKRMSSHSPTETLVRNTSTCTPPAKQSQYPSPAPTPTPAPAAVNNRSSWHQGDGSSVEILAPRKNGDSISVTARIIRDSVETKSNEPGNLPKLVGTSLHWSPLAAEHEKGEPIPQHETLRAVVPTAPTELEAKPTETPKPERRRFSLSSGHSNGVQLAQSESFTKRLSTTLRHVRNESSNPPRSASDSSSIVEDKLVRDSRKTRLMRRVSVLTAGPRSSIVSAFGSHTPRREEAVSVVGQPPSSIAEDSGEVSPENSSMAESHTHVVDIGDVNIQFPDTLLWKRRFMRIDDQGFLILTPPTMEANKRGISRRFHLSDMKKPCLPSLEREELPWSIVLDLEDGSCLQCACESRYAQGQVLRMLEDAHAAYRSLYLPS